MKTKILFIALVVICFASCIPSLHPIFTEQNRITDDRIIGDWVSSANTSYEIGHNISIQSDEIEQSELNEEIKNSILNNSDEVKYRFERSATITYAKGDIKSGKNYTKITLPLQRESLPHTKLLKKGFEVTDVEHDPNYILTFSEISEGRLIEDVMIVNLTNINGNIYMDFHPHQDFKKPSRFDTNFIPAHTFAKVEFKNNALRIMQFDSDYIEELIKNKRVRLKHEIINDQIILTASTNDLRAFIHKYGNDEKLFLESDELALVQ